MSDAAAELARGWQLHQAGQLGEAERIYSLAVRAEPQNANAWCYLGMACHDQDRFEEAAVAYQRAIALQPHFPIAYNNLGNTRRLQRRLSDALACFDEALRQKPDYLNAFKNKGTTLLWEGHIDAARGCYEQALRLSPEDAETRKNLAVIALLQGRFEVGWPEYEWRLKAVPGLLQGQFKPRWEGESLDGRTILICAEQGLGDTIHFIRYAARLKSRFDCRVIASVQRTLLPLLTNCPGIDQLVAQDDQSVEFDVWSPLLSLPGLLGEFSAEQFPTDVPYLSVPEELDRFWREELARWPGVKIGITWQGNPKHQADRMRSVPLTEFIPLGGLAGLQLISLQKGFGSEQLDTVEGRLDIWPLADRLDQSGAFLDTAAVMKNLDLVIASDTSTVHLAGALGVPTWVALSHVPDWRWLLDRTDSPWYPTMRLFRQPRPGAWGEVFEQISVALREQFPSLRTKTSTEHRLATTGRNRVTRGRHGLMLFNRHDQYIGRSLDLYGEFSEVEVELFRQLIGPGRVVVEAGANIGAHTVPLARMVGPSGRVHAFEPQRPLFQILCANVALNSLGNVECRPDAVGDTSGWLVVPSVDYDRETNFGGLSLAAAGQGERVLVTTIDSLNLTRCDLLKADVEGMELSVLQGARATIERFRPFLYIENDRREKSPAVIEFLMSLGYKLYWHLPYMYHAKNYFQNKHNEFGRTLSANLLGIHESIPANIVGLPAIESPTSWWQ